MPLRPDPGAWTIDAFAQADDGTFAGFSARYAVMIPPDGKRYEASGAPLLLGDAIGAAWLQPVGSSTGTRFIVATQRDDLLDLQRTDFRIFAIEDGRLASHPAAIHGIDAALQQLGLSRMIRYPDSSGRVLLVGSIDETVRTPFAALCMPAVDGLVCQDTVLDCGQLSGGNAEDMLVLPDETLVAFLNIGTGRGIAYRPPNGIWTCDLGLQDRSFANRTGTVSAVLDSVTVIGALEHRVFVCADEFGTGRSMIITASISRASSDPTSTRWTLAAQLNQTQGCAAFAPLLEGAGPPTTMRLSTSERKAIDFDLSGAVIQEGRALDDLYPSLSPVLALFSATNGWTIAASGYGSGYYLSDHPPIAFARRAQGQTFQPIVGTLKAVSPEYSAVLERDGTFFAFGGGGLSQRITILSPGAPARASLASLPLPLPDSFAPSAAAWDSRPEMMGSVVLVGAQNDNPAVFRVSVDRGTAQSIAVPNTVRSALHQIHEAAPGQFALATDDSLFWMKDDAIFQIALPPTDDPSTGVVETTSTGVPDVLDGMTGSLGMVWVVAFDRLMRLKSPASTPGALPTAETFSLATRLPSGDLSSTPQFLGAIALCPDRLVIGERSRVYETLPAHDLMQESAPEIRARIYPSVNQGPTIRHGIYSGASRFAGTGQGFTVFFSTRIAVRHGTYQPRLPFAVEGVATDALGNIILGATDGRIAIAYDE
jgi:hypothetical protein